MYKYIYLYTPTTQEVPTCLQFLQRSGAQPSESLTPLGIREGEQLRAPLKPLEHPHFYVLVTY